MKQALLTVSWAIIAATVLPFIRRGYWWIRLFDFPRTQITLFALGAIILLIFNLDYQLWDVVTLALLSSCALYQCWELSAYTSLRRVQALPNESSDPSRRLRLIAANVLMTNKNVGEYLEIIQRESPDIVVLAEADDYWESNLRSLERGFPYTMKCPLSNTYGLLLYSRLPLSQQQVLFRVERDVPSFRATVTLPCGDEFQIHALHPRPPHVGVDTIERDAELIIVAKEVKDAPFPVIVTGDLNDVAWSHTTRLFLRISGMLDPRVGRAFCNTFHAAYPFFRWPLDHLFHSRAFRLVKLARLEKTGSDHYPVLVELSFEPEIRTEQERPQADVEDVVEANAKLNELQEKRD